MEMILLGLMVLGLIIVFSVDTIQKRREFLSRNRHGKTYPITNDDGMLTT